LERDLSWRETLLRQLHAEAWLTSVRSHLPFWSSRVLSQVAGESAQALRQLSGLNDPRHLYVYCGCEHLP
jgi:hypothetical protein